MNFLKIDDLDINYYDSKTPTSKAIIFIHGNSHSLKTFRYQLSNPDLNSYRLIALDLPGHGSSAVSGHYDMNLFVKVIKGLVEILELEEVILLGHSLGGHIAIESIPVVNPKGILIFGTPPLKKPLTIHGFRDYPTMGLLQKNKLSLPEANSLLLSLYSQYVPDQKDITEFMQTDFYFRELLAESFGGGVYSDEVEILKGYEGAAAIIHGLQDNLIDLSYLQNELEIDQLWNKTVIALDAPHNLHIECHEDLNSLILRFAQHAFMDDQFLIRPAPVEASKVFV